MATANDAWAEPQEDQEFGLDSSAFTGEDLGGAAGDIVSREGWYHFEVVNVKPELATKNDKGEPTSPYYRIDCVVLETVDGQSPASSRLFHKLYVAGQGGGPPKDGTVKKTLRFGRGLGLLKEIPDGVDPATGKEKTKIVDAATGSTTFSSKIFLNAKGRQFVAKVVLDEGEKDANGKKVYKDKYEIPWGDAFAVDDPAVAHVAKNKEAMALIGKASAPAATTAAPAKQPAPAAAPVVDDLGDL